LKTYEKDMKTIADCLLTFANNSYNVGIKKRMHSILGLDKNNLQYIDPNDPTSTHKLKLMLYKNSICKFK
jgi:hypothetical protein